MEKTKPTGRPWKVSAVIRPYAHSNWSKNTMWKIGARGRKRFLSRGHRLARDRLASAIAYQVAISGAEPTAGILRLLVHVYLENHRGDAINCLDLVADAVQKGTGVNDRWFMLDALTWEIDRKDPRLLVVASQGC